MKFKHLVKIQTALSVIATFLYVMILASLVSDWMGYPPNSKMFLAGLVGLATVEYLRLKLSVRILTVTTVILTEKVVSMATIIKLKDIVESAKDSEEKTDK